MILRPGQHYYRMKIDPPTPKEDATPYERNRINGLKYEISFRICHKSQCGYYVAAIDWTKAMSSDNPSKPKIFSVNGFKAMVKRERLESGFHDLPYIMSISDEALLDGNTQKQKWLDRRDKKFSSIESLLSNDLIEKYLYGEGLHQEMQKLVDQKNGYKGTTGYINALNKFIAFGLTKNALLPLKWLNCGTNHQLPSGVNEQRKRGRGSKDTSFRQVVAQDIENIKDLISYLKEQNERGQKINMRHAYDVFDQYYQFVEIQRESSNGGIEKIYCPLPEEQCISYRQFAYHLDQQLGLIGKQKLIASKIDYEKDIKDRQGSARDGVLGATHRYEVDATVLDIYVRYPFNKSGRYSMGRPVLYLVIDVHSSMIVGFYLGFDGPNSDGVSQALANAMLDKVEFASRYGMYISSNDWPCHHVPIQITTDNGTEYPYKLIATILTNELGVETVNYTAIYRGDFKGTVESGLKRLNNEFVHYEAGAIFKTSARDEQHASNKAFWDYEALVRLLINQIIIHNKTAYRPGKLTKGAAEAGVSVSPEALFLYSLEHEMDGGEATSSKDEGRVRWGLLKEERATVREDCVYFEGLEYHSEYFKLNGLYARANKNAFKIIVKRARDWTNHIFHKTVSGEYIKLTLKNVNNSSAYSSTNWETALHLLSFVKTNKHVLRREARYLRAVAQTRKQNYARQIWEEFNGLPENTRKSIQPGIAARQEIQKQILASEHARRMMHSFGLSTEEFISHNEEPGLGLNEQLFG